MNTASYISVLSSDLRDRVATRIGVSYPLPLDHAGLSALYAAWCLHVPFDNVRKLIAVRHGVAGPLPGADAIDFLENFLAHGTGGTCWSSSNALFQLVTAFGFDARRIAGSMRDLGVPGHGSVKVRIDERDWMVDSSMLSMYPIPISTEPYTFRDAMFGVEVEPVDGTHIVWFNTPPYDDYFPCRLLFDPVPYEFYLERYEISRDRGPFNHHLSVRYNRGNSRMVLQGHKRHKQTGDRPLESVELTREQLVDVLQHDVGMSESIVAAWVACGALDAAFEPPLVPPAALTRRPPSTRDQ
jgi:arylamine N-acetyltransferase